MANCNDCICSEVCYYKSFNDVRNLKKRRNDVEKICNSFVHRDSVKKAPTVDAVEVVRCKDCKHWQEADDGRSWQMIGRTDGACRWLAEQHYAERYMTEGEHFCSYGERKDDE